MFWKVLVYLHKPELLTMDVFLSLFLIFVLANTVVPRIIIPPNAILNDGISPRKRKANRTPYTGSSPAVTLANWARTYLKPFMKSP